jgi:glutathione S-transferase
MKLYFSPGACSMASHIALAETDLSYTTEKVDLRSKKTASGADFSQINPKGGYVPCLQLASGEILTEGTAILQYIADQKPDSGLAPKAGSLERYRLEEWLTYTATELHKGFSPLWGASSLVADAAAQEELKSNVTKRLHTRFEWVNKALAGKKFAMGDTFTIVDCYLFTVLGWSRILKLDMTPYSNIMGFMERVSGRPSVQKAMKTEGLLG